MCGRGRKTEKTTLVRRYDARLHTLLRFIFDGERSAGGRGTIRRRLRVFFDAVPQRLYEISYIRLYRYWSGVVQCTRLIPGSFRAYIIMRTRLT